MWTFLDLRIVETQVTTSKGNFKNLEQGVRDTVWLIFTFLCVQNGGCSPKKSKQIGISTYDDANMPSKVNEDKHQFCPLVYQFSV